MMEIAKMQKQKQHYISSAAHIAESAVIADNVTIEACVVIGDNVRIAQGTVIRANSTIYENVTIGENCCINSNVSLYNDTIIGNNCIIHAGTVIGADGFGYIEHPDGSFTKVPQLGNVVIHDDVEIGANCTIDRAMIGSTIIKSGVKLDNLVHIAHNCEIGKNSASAAQTGVSGSTIIGERVRLGGQVGLAGHLTIADDVKLLAQSGVAKTIDKKGTYFGAPAKDQMKAFKIEAVIRQLPELLSDLRDLQKKVKKIEENKGQDL
jgi:UDP-3-O-[3-hydroxymyristoyl] glucosamine N-acyltransferase